MYTALDWPWGKALAVSPTGHVLQVEDILFGTVKERLAELGIRVGSVVECLGSEELDVRVRLPDGRVVRVSRAYAWFVCTKNVLEQRASPWGGATIAARRTLACPPWPARYRLGWRRSVEAPGNLGPGLEAQTERR